MMWRLLTLCAAMVTMAMAKNVQWEDYKATYGLSFEDHEETARLTAFEANLKIIKDHNFDADLGKHSYWLGVNKFAHMTNEEYVAKVIGACFQGCGNTKSNATKWTADPILTDLPATVDWRTKGMVTPVKNQGQCGSCWAFSATGSLEGQHQKKSGKLVSLSEQQLVDCAGDKWGNHGCSGGGMDGAFKYIKDNGGIDTEESYSYQGEDEKCHYEASNVGATATGFVDVKSKDESALQQTVATIGPISVAIDASHMSFQLYSGGVYHNWFCSQTSLDHAVLVVGYGTDNGKDYWLVKNSWGPSWGLKGYIMMSRNRSNNCGIATCASYPLV